MKRRIATLALTAASLFALTSCAGLPLPGAEDSTPRASSSADDTQSVAEACAAVQESFRHAGDALNALGSSEAMAQPEQTIAVFTETIEMIADTVDKIGNADVLAATASVQKDFTAVSDTLTRLLVDKDPLAATAVPGVASDLQSSLEELATLCTP